MHLFGWILTCVLQLFLLWLSSFVFVSSFSLECFWLFAVKLLMRHLLLTLVWPLYHSPMFYHPLSRFVQIHFPYFIYRSGFFPVSPFSYFRSHKDHSSHIFFTVIELCVFLVLVWSAPCSSMLKNTTLFFLLPCSWASSTLLLIILLTGTVLTPFIWGSFITSFNSFFIGFLL